MSGRDHCLNTDLLKPLDQYVRSISRQVFTPGAVLAYSIGTHWQLHCKETVSDQPLPFTPREDRTMGMSSTFEQDLPGSLAWRVSPGYRWAAGDSSGESLNTCRTIQREA